MTLRRTLHFDERTAAVHDDVHIRLRVRILRVIQIQHRPCRGKYRPKPLPPDRAADSTRRTRLSISVSTASASATKPPVIAAVRVPPSACSTSQSTVTCARQGAFKSTTARSARPIRRWISCVRPVCLPRAASRAARGYASRAATCRIRRSPSPARCRAKTTVRRPRRSPYTEPWWRRTPRARNPRHGRIGRA